MYYSQGVALRDRPWELVQNTLHKAVNSNEIAFV